MIQTNEQIREELQRAVSQVAQAHGMTVNIGEVELRDEAGAVADIHNVTVQGSEEQVSAIFEKFYEAREAHNKLHSKARYRHRMIVAISIGAGIYGFYSLAHREFVLHGLEYLLPAIVDKLIFGLGE